MAISAILVDLQRFWIINQRQQQLYFQMGNERKSHHRTARLSKKNQMDMEFFWALAEDVFPIFIEDLH